MPYSSNKEHIPGAVNIEWRQVLARRSELPINKPILIYCNTGTLSAQVGFALRVAGFDNLRILQAECASGRRKADLILTSVRCSRHNTESDNVYLLA